jgi:hypothetical protein
MKKEGRPTVARRATGLLIHASPFARRFKAATNWRRAFWSLGETEATTMAVLPSGASIKNLWCRPRA